MKTYVFHVDYLKKGKNPARKSEREGLSLMWFYLIATIGRVVFERVFQSMMIFEDPPIFIYKKISPSLMEYSEDTDDLLKHRILNRVEILQSTSIERSSRIIHNGL